MFGRKAIMEKRHKFGVPDNAKFANYFGGYNKDIGSFLLFWTDSSAIHFCELNPSGKNSDPVVLDISKENIIAFTMTGDISTQTNVKGGGASIGGALIGAAIAGPAGAIIGGHKNVKTQTKTLDTRRTFLKFKEDGLEKTMQFSDELYNDLCMFCLEKKI